MKNVLKLLMVAVFASVVFVGVKQTMAGSTKVAVVHINSTGNPEPGEVGYTYPQPGYYTIRHFGKVIEVGENAAEVFVGKGDILVDDIETFGTVVNKGDDVEVAVNFQVLEDGSEVDYYPYKPYLVLDPAP